MAKKKALKKVQSRTKVVVAEESVSDDTIIWRYFKFERFLRILSKHELWFSRPSAFDDKWEGLFPPSYVRGSRQYAKAHKIPFKEFDQEFRRRELRHRHGHFVNCWHISSHESDAMWRLYGLAGSGIAIQSTVGDFKECLRPHNSGKVIYYDPSNDIVSKSIFGPHDILFKREDFTWEQEYRFWFDDDDLLQKIEAGKKFQTGRLSKGMARTISDLQRFIEKIVVAPGASDEFISVVRSACGEYHKNWLRSTVERSYSDRMWDSFKK